MSSAKRSGVSNNLTYSHTQRAPLCLLLYAIAALFFAVAWVQGNGPVIPWVLLPVAALILVLAAAFHHQVNP